MGSRLIFTRENHTYSLDGKRVPGVTTAIGKATPKNALAPAAAKFTAEHAADNIADLALRGREAFIATTKSAYQQAWRASAEVGTLLHEAAWAMVTGDPVTPRYEDGTPWPDEVVASARQLARFMDEWAVEPVLAETAVFNDVDRWGGMLDLVATLRDEGRWLLDYKTGRTGIYPEHAVQLAAYRHATHYQRVTDDGDLEDAPMIPVDRAGCVWVRPDGYQLVPVRSDAGLYEVFRHMLPVAAWASERREQSVFAPVPVPPAPEGVTR